MAIDRTQQLDLDIVRYEYDDVNRPQRAVLFLETGKAYNKGLEATATVFWISSASRSHAFGLGGGGDYSKKIATEPTARATQKAIDTFNTATFTPAVCNALLEDAKGYYAAGMDKR
jgi:IMP cyclohydrolase